MDIADLNETELYLLLMDLQTTYDSSVLQEKYGITLPQWLTVKYRCVACAKETRSRIQVKSIRTANKQLICPFCRKVSKIFNIHTQSKDKLII